MKTARSAPLFLLFALSLFLPTSLHGVISSALAGFWFLVCIAGLAVIVCRLRPLPILKSNFVIGQVLIALLLLFTLLSPLNGLALGAVVPYLGFATVLSVNYRRLQVGPFSMRIFALLAAVLLVLGWGTVCGSAAINGALEANYQMYYDELFEQMVGWYAKPVSVYATHSLSAFAYFAFAVTFFRLAQGEVRIGLRLLWIMLCLGFALLIPFLMSNSAIGLTVILTLLFFWYLFKSGRLFLLAALLLAAAVALALYGAPLFALVDATFQVQDIFSSNLNGFAGRFSTDSRLSSTYRYLMEYSFWPVGLSNDPAISFGDNFIAEYIVRLSPIGYVLILVMLYRFLRANLQSKRMAQAFFLFFLMGDQSFPLLTSFRFLFMLPVLVLLWNGAAQLGTVKPRRLRFVRRRIFAARPA
jgi:hypothetical protein